MKRQRQGRAISARDLCRAVDQAGVPPAILKLWLVLWTRRRGGNTIKDPQEVVARWCGLPDRTFRWQVDLAAQWGMLTNHRGVNGNPSWLVLRPPHQWRSEPDPGAGAGYPSAYTRT